MGVLCMAVHVPPEGGRMVVVTGGDDQAVCVAEVELHDNAMKPFDQGSAKGGETSCSDEKTSAGKRCGTIVGKSSRTTAGHSRVAIQDSIQQGACNTACVDEHMIADLVSNIAFRTAILLNARRFAVKLVRDKPEVTNGAAGSAIKGLSVVPVCSPVSGGPFPPAETHVSPGVEKHPAAGDRTRRPSIALSVFTISRDQRLSRWDLAEENTLDTCIAIRGVDGRHSSGSRSLADSPGSSSSQDLCSGGDRGRRCSDVIGGTGRDRVRTALWHPDSDGLRQRTRQDENEEPMRWRLRWRAGCVTDVADVSGLDVYLLPGDPKHYTPNGGEAAVCGQSASTEGGRNATDEVYVFPGALVAVSGQGLQLVLFGAC